MAKVCIMAQSSLRSDEFSKLYGKEKKHYLEKIALLSGIDPYTLKGRDLTEDLAILPPLRYCYFCFVVSTSLEWPECFFLTSFISNHQQKIEHCLAMQDDVRRLYSVFASSICTDRVSCLFYQSSMFYQSDCIFYQSNYMFYQSSISFINVF